MLKYSRYVLINESQDPMLYCTVQGISLPIDASDAILSANFMLAGQEDDALDYKLFNPRGTKITIIPTWGCNLRCKHCVVIDKLEKGSHSDLDVEQLIDFMAEFGASNIIKNACLVGGEPLLRPDLILALMNRLPNWGFSVTSNLTVDLTEDHLSIIDRLKSMSVSVDGLPHNHNSQRISLNKEPDVFGKTVSNIKRLVKCGYKAKISIQAAVQEINADERDSYIHFFANIGISLDLISYGLIHPHPRGAGKGFHNLLKNMPIVTNPCCKYQPGSQCTILPDNTVVSDFYTRTPLGTIYDDPKDIIEKHRQLLREYMPAYNDPVCRKCEVIGLCWGQCSNCEPLTGMNPSKYCDQEGLIAKAKKLAASGHFITHRSPQCSP